MYLRPASRQDELSSADRYVDGGAALASREEIDETRQRLVGVSIGPLLAKYQGQGAEGEDDLYGEANAGGHEEL